MGLGCLPAPKSSKLCSYYLCIIVLRNLYLVRLKMIVTCNLLIKAKVLCKNQGLYDNVGTILS